VIAMKLDALDHVGLAVSDMAASIEFYEGVLGLTRAHEATWGDYPAVFEANGSGVALFSRTDGFEARSEDPVRHVGFRTSRPGLDSAKRQLTASGIDYEEGDYAVAWSIYLPDPDGYVIEITTYEPAGNEADRVP
jgi:catechol 2,3-dioxygenase-like lactoylglutathione lyase family enzyme